MYAPEPAATVPRLQTRQHCKRARAERRVSAGLSRAKDRETTAQCERAGETGKTGGRGEGEEREKRQASGGGWMDRGCGIDARKTERISRASGRDEHEINGNVRRNMELEAGEDSRWAKSIEGGALGRRGERTGGRERRKRECRVEHTRMEWSVYGCARTHVVGVASAAADVAAVPRYRRSCWTPSASPRDMIYQPFLQLLASPSCTLFVLFLPHSCAAPGGGGGGAGTVLLLAILFSALS